MQRTAERNSDSVRGGSRNLSPQPSVALRGARKGKGKRRASLEDLRSSANEDFPSGPVASTSAFSVLGKRQLTGKKRKGSPSPLHVLVSGIKLHPTEAFDTLWYFAAERKAIDDRRRTGKPGPWTKDPILQKYYFCNTFRVLDKVCQYLIREVIETGSQEPNEVVFRVILFNTFTKIETWELLVSELGPPRWSTYQRTEYEDVLGRAKQAGKVLYTGSFIKPAPQFGYLDNYMNHLCLIEVMMENNVATKLISAKYLEDAFEYLVSFPSMGDFTTYQLLLNLSYSNILNFHRNDFVIAGLGASSGLGKIFEKVDMAIGRRAVPNFETEVIRWMVDNQEQQFKRLKLNFTGLGSARLPMDVSDMEHTICEVDKYCRIAHPELKGKRTELRRNFQPSETPYPKRPILPNAWRNPARKTPRSRPDNKLVIEKRYTVDSIQGDRQGPSGVQYYVLWLGYPDSAATWEFEDSLLADAPALVEEYLAKKRHSK